MFKRATECGGATLLLLWLLGLLSIGLELVTPSQVGHLTDLVQQADRQAIAWSQVNRAILYLLGAQLLIAVFTFFRSERAVLFEQSLVHRVVRDIFARLLRFSPDFFRDRDVESINARTLEDTRMLATFWAQAMVTVPLATISVIVFGAYMLWHNRFLGICLIPLSLLSGYFLLFDRLIQDVNRRSRETWDDVRTRCREVVAGVDEIRNHSAFDFGLSIVDSSFSGFTAHAARLGRWSAFFGATGPFIAAVQSGALYWLGAGLCMSGSWLAGVGGALTWGDVIRFLLVAGLFRTPVREIASFVLLWRMTRENARRLEEYLHRPIEFGDAGDGPLADTAAADICFQDVSLVAPSGSPILDGLSARIPAGQHVAVVGYAGCGKSTALRMIVRGVSPSAGKLLVSDQAVTELSIRELAETVGFVPQTPQLFEGSIRHNLLLALRRPGRRVLQDELGPIDVTLFGDDFGETQLDQKLLEAVRRVGFDEDVFQKSLDSPLPPSARFDPLRRQLPELRQSVQTELQREDAGWLAPFDATALLVPATVHENLLGPGVRLPETTKQEAEWLFESLQGTPCFGMLLRLGFVRVVSEHAVASRLTGAASRLAERFAAWKRAKLLDVDELADARFDEVTRTPTEFQQALWEIALDTDIEVARQVLAEPFVGAVLEARQKIGAMQGAPAETYDRWRSLASLACHEHLSLRENIVRGRVPSRIFRGRERIDALVRQALTAAGLLDLALLAGLEYRVGENGKFLSGGQRQKISLARVLLKNPQILLLDEATASLDEISQARVVNMLARDFRGHTMVSISHRLSTVKDFDRILVLDRGRLVQEGTPGELAAQVGPFQDLLSQREGTEGQPVAAAVGGEPAAAPLPADPQALRSALQRSPLLAELDGDQLLLLEGVARSLDCPAGTVLFRRGDPGCELFLVCEGEVEFLAPGRERDEGPFEVVDTDGPGGTFGELALFGEGVRTLTARAKTSLRLVSFDRDTLLELISADPRIAAGFLRVLSRRLAAIREELYGAA